MSRLNELAATRRKHIAEMEQLLEGAKNAGRGLTGAEMTRFDTLSEEVKVIDRQGEAEAARTGSTSSWGRSPGLEERPRDLTSASGERRLSGPFESAGSFFRAVQRAGTPGQSTDPRLHEIRSASGLNEGVGSEGGFLIQPSLASELIRAISAESNVFPRCRPWPVGSNSNGIKIPRVDETSRATGSRLGGVRGYWANEADEKTASKPKFGQLELNLKKLIALCYVTDELFEDSTLLGTFLQQAFTEEMSFLVDDAIINGTGVGQPLGILTSPALVTVDKEASQAADTILYANVVKMLARLPAGSLRNAVWLINGDVLPQLLQMTIPVKNVAGSENVGGSAAYLPGGSAAGAPFGTLLGRPVLPIEQAATIGDKGDIILADLSRYFYIARNLRMDSSIHVRFIYDESAFRFVWRIDGSPAWKNAVTPYKGVNTVSPFVALAAR